MYVISRGYQGLAVLKIQEYLNVVRSVYPTIPLIEEDADYGAQTEQAVRAFQRATGLMADGVVGTLTWDKLIAKFKTIDPDPDPQPEPPVTQPLEYGSEGLEVQKMQGYLNTLMPNTAPLVVDGKYGTKTEAKVIQYQMKNGLVADGKIGNDTWDLIVAQV